MTTEAEQQEKISLGREAQALKNNPALEVCMNSTLEDLFVRWMSTGPSDYDERDAIWSTAQALKEFRDTLAAAIDSGKLEERIRDDQQRNYK